MAENPADSPSSALNPSALALGDRARLLTKVGNFSLTEAMVRADVAAGAPLNPDGTLNLVFYAAWLVKEAGGGD